MISIIARALTVREAVDGQPIRAGEVWIAPGGRQMKVQRQGDQVVLRITDDPPENSCRPSVDYLFRSVAEVYGGRAVGVIMTGMGNDGSVGCRRLKHCGAGSSPRMRPPASSSACPANRSKMESPTSSPPWAGSRRKSPA